MNFKKHLPYVVAALLLALLLTMVQSSKVMVKGRISSQNANAMEQARPDYFYLPPGANPVSSLTEADYNDVIGKFLMRYFSKVHQMTGRPLVIPLEWSNPYFAAHAQDKGPYMQISMWGGMARAPGATKAVLAAVLCHELGHIIGGEPRQTIPGADWASTEGQSDFFAAAVCLPDFFQAHPGLRPAASAEVLKICGNDIGCQGVLQAGWETVQFFQKYSYREYEPVRLDTAEKATEVLIRNSYPSDQCRLDSFVAGARCQLGASCRAPLCWLPADK